MLIICSCILIIIGLVMKSPYYIYLGQVMKHILMLMNISIYIWGSIFVMVGLGMNTFINAQGFAKKECSLY